MLTTTPASRSEPRIDHVVRLCTDQGHLNRAAVGWSPVTYHDVNFTGNYFRKKRYDAWGVQSDDAYFCTALVDLGYLGYTFAFLYDLQTGDFAEVSRITPFCKGIHVARNVDGESYLRSRSLRISYHRQPPTREHDGSVILEVNAHLSNGDPFTAELIAEYPRGEETMNVVIPWSERKFHFTSKHAAIPAHGIVTVGNKTTNFVPERSFAWLDFGRGIWPYESAWNWTIAGGISDGRRVGFNFGSGWTDGTGMTENAIFVDGKVHKLAEDIRFDYDPTNVLAPWHLRSVGTPRVDLVFTPKHDRFDATNAILIKSSLHQVIGHFSGSLIDDEGNRIAIQNLVGVVEEHKARW